MFPHPCASRPAPRRLPQASLRLRHLRQRHFRRGGVSLVELCIVVAIFGIMAAMASQYMAGMMPAWRVKRASKEFMVHCQQARDLAISEGVEYRVLVDLWDTDPSGGETNIGSYYVQRGNLTSMSTAWDTLPMDEDGVANDSEGHYEFTRDTPAALPWVSLQEPTVASIIFDSRGFLENAATDFDGQGMINFVFFNKRALVVDGVNEWWEVSVSRAGFARLTGVYSTPIGSGVGTSGTTNFATSSGSGYTGG